MVAAARKKPSSASLREYRRKRDFRRTAEPAGRKTAARISRAASRFVVQKHAASHLHFDFRLEHDGVLKSWAVPKGPSADPDVRRLAVEVEDHPIDYIAFEGTIPEGEYGGGTVMVWDQGTYQPINDIDEGFRKGHLKFALRGKRLKGGWSLTRMSRGSTGSSSKPQWLLRKERDRWAHESVDEDDSAGLVNRHLTSIVSKRRMEQIAGAANGQAGGAMTKPTSKNKPKKTVKASKVASRRSVSANGHAARGKSSAGMGTFRLTNPDRVVYPEAGITKRDVAQFYFDIAEWILPHVANRPLSVLRCPAGRAGQCFVQKHPRPGGSEAIRTVRIREKSGADEYMFIDDVEGLVATVQMGGMELHPWGCRSSSIEFADYLVFDLDPGPGIKWKSLVQAAGDVRKELERIDLQAYVRTSGGKGLHVVAPLMAGVRWDQAKELAHTIARLLEARDPKRYVSTMTKSKRGGRIFIDYLRNGRGATAVASYSTRARDGAPVATPVRWDELPKLNGAADFTVANLRSRLARLKHDPWEGFRLPTQQD